ncbi:MAG: Ig-like domain-containing protein [Candidatus Acidiferrales bacterium]
MSKLMVRFFVVLALLATGVIGGCGREQTPAVPPVVVSTVPANGAAGVALSSVITATFNETMNPATITSATFTLTAPGGLAISGTVVGSGLTATFTPMLPLASSTLYTATITTGAQSNLGIALAANYVWTFTTGFVPVVTSTIPANGAANVPLNQKITATFNQAMNPATITAAGTFTVAVAGGGAAVAGTVTYVAGANTAIFTPTMNLAPTTVYTAMITTAAQSVGGIPLAANHSWTFSTGIAINSTAPTVIATVPIADAIDVPTNTMVTATFSKAMDPSTITATGTFTLAVFGVGGAAVPGTVQYAGAIATFTPTNALTAATEYTATITTAAKDLTGNALGANYVWSFTTGAGPSTTPPTITLTSPADLDTGVTLNAAVNATFSEAMNPTTLLAPGTFTVAVSGVGGAAVTGNVTYDPTSDTATFTPLANLAPSTNYTATISNAATDVSGDPLIAGTTPNPWSFMTGTALGQLPPDLGTAATFGSLGGNAGITNQGINTVINGDIGTTGASTLVTGFNDAGVGCVYTETGSDIGMVNGNIDTAPPPPTGTCLEEGTAATFAIAQQAALDANAAYLSLTPASRPGGTDPGAGQLGGLTLPPGTYQAALGSFLITGSDLTLDAQGNANAVWVFQMASTLTVGGPGAPRNVILINGALAQNVFWQVGSAATINPAGGGTMVGTIIASQGITFSTPGNATVTTLNGRALSLNASVTMVNTVINVPAP